MFAEPEALKHECVALITPLDRSSGLVVTPGGTLVRGTQKIALCPGYGVAGTEPATTIDCWVTILSMLVGCCLWTVLGGIVTTLLIHLNAASSEYTAKMQELYQYMAHRHLPQV